MRGAWIEIFAGLTVSFVLPLSLPVRGAWIEIGRHVIQHSNAGESLPVRGAWIEIACRFSFLLSFHCRSPCGERGLKWTVVECKQNARKVAPRAGSVD